MSDLIDFDVVKKRVYENIDVLTELSTDAYQIKEPIEQSNKRMKEITDEISKLNTKNKLVKLVQLSVLEDQIPKIKSETDFYIEQLRNGCVEVEAICYDYNLTIDNIVRDLDSLPDNNKDREDILGIISINRLKLANLKTHIKNARNQINAIGKFRTFTLHHLTDSIKSVKTDQKKSLLDEIKNKIGIFSVRSKLIIITLTLIVFLTIYNYIALNYYITYSSTILVAKEVEDGSFFLTKFANFIQTVGYIFGVSIFALMGFRYVDGEDCLYLLIPAIFAIYARPIFEIIFPLDHTGSVEKTVQISYYFYNFGTMGLIILFVLIGFAFILLFLNRRQLSQYESSLMKLTAKNQD